MRITEIISNVYLYVSTIRVKNGKSSTVVRTIVFADGISQARAMLSVIFGDENVVSVTRITDSQLSEAVSNVEKRIAQRVPRVLPSKYAHGIVRQTLIHKMKRKARHVKPVVGDLRAAQSDFEAEQKRANREYQKALNDNVKWSKIKRRRLEKFG